VWEVDPLTCPRCGTETKIISFITEAAVIQHILEHLGKWEEKKEFLLGLVRAPPDSNLDEEVSGRGKLEDMDVFQDAPPDEIYFMDTIYSD